MVKRLFGTAAVVLAAMPGSALAAQQQAPAPLTGEILYYADNTRLSTGAQCTTDPATGRTTYTLHVDDGFAIGAYPGTFDESVTVTLEPTTVGPQPFPVFDLPGDNDPPIPGSVDVGLNFQQRVLANVQVTFRIDSAAGQVEGTKTLNGTLPAPPNSGACAEFTVNGDVSGFYKDLRVYDLEYEARIQTAAGTFVDEGSAALTAREGIAQRASDGALFFRFEDLLETFTSSLGVPVELKPGLGCGDLNHVHERAGECRNQT